MESKVLKPYKGFTIEKSWETKADGTIKKDTVLYTAYTKDGNSVYDAKPNLAELKKEIDRYSKLEYIE